MKRSKDAHSVQTESACTGAKHETVEQIHIMAVRTVEAAAILTKQVRVVSVLSSNFLK